MVIQNRVTAPDWTDEDGGGEDGARCRLFLISRDPDGLVRNDTWFQDAEEALQVCNGEYTDPDTGEVQRIGSPCPVRRDCLRVALVNNDHHGVFGGMTAPQRKWIRRNVPKEKWSDDAYLREMTPKADYFQNYGDEDPEEEARKT